MALEVGHEEPGGNAPRKPPAEARLWASNRAELAALQGDKPLPPLLQRLLDGAPPLPMQRGLTAVLASLYPEVPQRKFWLLRHRIALSAAYCKAVLAADAQRHDLAGVPAEPIEDEARRLASKRLRWLSRADARLGGPLSPPPEPPPVPARTGRNGRSILNLPITRKVGS